VSLRERLTTQKAQPLGWAFSFWGLVIVAASVLAVTDANTFATWLAASLLPVTPAYLSWLKRTIFFALALSVLVAGPQLLLLIVPAVLAITGRAYPAAVSFGLLTSLVLLYPHFQSVNVHGPLSIPLASFSFILVSAWVPAIIFFRVISWKSLIALFLLPVATILILSISSAHWLKPSILTNDLVRLILAVLPTAIVSCFSTLRSTVVPPLKWTVIPMLVGWATVSLIPYAPFSSIVFDESHGKWETVQSSFGPESFGRNSNYTYTELFKKADRLVGRSSIFENESAPLPGVDSLMIVKVPAESLSEMFESKLTDWVAKGGRLLVIADHTDLYDTTQNINSLLTKNFGMRINADAVYDATGMPNIPTIPVAGGLLGQIVANNRQFAWQTGASLEQLPTLGIELMSYGPSFSEPGDYSRANRFGPFVPELTKRYFNHSAAIGFAHGLGAVAVVLDSTPWSNFSIFKEEYNQMFRGLVRALEQPYQLRILATGAIILGILAIVANALPLNVTLPILGLIMGCTLGSGTSIGSVSWSNHIEGRDFNVRVHTGPNARLEFLKQLVLPGEHNYSRIVSALGKYDLMPIAFSFGEEHPTLIDSKDWLFIEPSPAQLPEYRHTRRHLRQGGNLVFLFSPQQATDTNVLRWLNDWGLITQNSIGLSVSDGMTSSSGSFLGGRGPVLSRNIRVITTAYGSSLLKPYEADQFLQSYTLRPTKLPRESGFITISFSADQFSDDAIGEVWEGINPSSLGRQRERLLASFYIDEERPDLMPSYLIRSAPRLTELPAFIVLENGAKKLAGQFENTNDDATTAYFRSLRDQAGSFITTHCHPTEPNKLTECSARLLGDDMIEWLVGWRSSSDGKIIAIELLHERRMSGLGSTWNVIFGK